MRFADYFGRAFSGVSASQFPWVKMLRESPVAKIVDVSLADPCFVIFLCLAVDELLLWMHISDCLCLILYVPCIGEE